MSGLRETIRRRGGLELTSRVVGGLWVVGERTVPEKPSPYNAAATAALKDAFPTQWPTIRDYGYRHPEIVPYVNANPLRWAISILYGGDHLQELFSTYQMCEYIEATGSQYINSGIYPTQETGFDIDYVMKNPVSTSGFGTLIGCRHGWNTTNARCYELTTYNGVPRCSESGGFGFGDALVNAGFVKDAPQNQKMINQVYTNALGVTTTFTENFTVAYPLHIFAMNGSEKGKGEISKLILYGGSTPIADYHPVYRKSDGVIGLFDPIRNRFDVNGGSGTFLKGQDV